MQHATRQNAFVTLAALLLLAAPTLAQPSFVEVTPDSNPYFVTPPEDDFWISAVAPADADGDGDLDLAVLGYYVVYNQSAEDRLVLLTNQGFDAASGRWLFAPTQVPLGEVFVGLADMAWGDVDGDGDDDLAVGSSGKTVIYRNSGGTLTQMPNLLPGYDEESSYSGAYDLRSLAWGDYDNDGDLDLLLPSVYDADLFEYSTHLIRNDGSDGAGGWLLTDVPSTIDPIVHAQSAWIDDDADGDLDLFVANVDPTFESGFLKRFDNAAGTFTGTDLVAGVHVEHGLADWGDADGDGDLDMLISGNILEADGSYNTVLRVYRNQGGSYTTTELIQAPNADWLDLHAATWADYDSDGDMDILVTGSYVGDGEIVGHSDVYLNQGGTFTALQLFLPAPQSSIGQGGAFTWFDIDQDGDLDYLIAGAYPVPNGNGLVESQMHLFRNDGQATNAAPTAPTGLLALPQAGGAIALSWGTASDDHTPAAALTYELEIRRAGEPFATAERLPEPGNLSAVTSWLLQGLPEGSYTWSLCAVDSAWNGGPSAQGSFSVGAASAIFADGFESGNLAAWSGVTP